MSGCDVGSFWGLPQGGNERMTGEISKPSADAVQSVQSGEEPVGTLNIASINRAERTFTFVDGDQAPLSALERVIACFTPGTLIATPKGEVPVERLQLGDRVLTRDNGIQTIRWVGHRKLDHLQLKKLKELRPIVIRAGALGGGRPERDMKVSPMHRMLVQSEVAQMYFDQTEVLIAAKDLTVIDGVEVGEGPYVTYVHFMCDQHEIVLSDGAWSESFQPGDLSMKGLDEDQRSELLTLFPKLASQEGLQEHRAARRTLKRDEARVLFSG